MRIYEDAIDGTRMHFSKMHQRWAVPLKIGVSRILDDERVVDDDGDEEEDGDDAAGGAGAGGGGGGGSGKVKGSTKGKGPKKSGGSKAPKPTTLAEALDLEEDQLGDEGEGDEYGDEEEGEGEAVGAKGQDEVLPRPTSVSPYWSTVYGQYMLASHSYHGALCKFHIPSTIHHTSTH